MSHATPSLTPEAQQQFEEQLPEWLAGQLDAQTAQWMHAMQQRHPQLQSATEELQSLRHSLRDLAQHENTDAAWALLQSKLAADAIASSAASPAANSGRARQGTPAADTAADVATHAAPGRTRPAAQTAPTRQPPRWLQWLWGHSEWANAAAAFAVVAVCAPSAWLVWQQPAPTESTDTAWRGTDLSHLAPAAPAHTRLLLQLQPGTSADALRTLATAASADTALWQAQSDNAWVLQLPQAAAEPDALLQRLRAQPQVASVRWLP